jgi:hypothetical protein
MAKTQPPVQDFLRRVVRRLLPLVPAGIKVSLKFLSDSDGCKRVKKKASDCLMKPREGEKEDLPRAGTLIAINELSNLKARSRSVQAYLTISQ